MSIGKIICKVSHGKPIKVTDCEFLIAFDFLKDEEESLLELLQMKIESDIYFEYVNVYGMQQTYEKLTGI